MLKQHFKTKVVNRQHSHLNQLFRPLNNGLNLGLNLCIEAMYPKNRPTAKSFILNLIFTYDLNYDPDLASKPALTYLQFY